MDAAKSFNVTPAAGSLTRREVQGGMVVHAQASKEKDKNHAGIEQETYPDLEEQGPIFLGSFREGQ